LWVATISFVKEVPLKRLSSLVFLTALSSGADAVPVDLASNEGLQKTCAALQSSVPGSLKRDQERVAYAICKGIELVKDAAAGYGRQPGGYDLSRPEGRREVRARLERYLADIGTIRAALEPIKSGKPITVIAPGTWEVDFDGDGKVSMDERHFFWVPKHGLEMRFTDRAGTEAEYRSRYTSPVILVDQADVHWALAYCNFIEAALNLVLAYDIVGTNFDGIALVDPDRIRRTAYGRMQEGVRQSKKLREALLRETDDDREWIANPRQANTSFPLAMDAQTFASWGTLLEELEKLLLGKTLLGGMVDSGEFRTGLRDLSLGMCPPGQGIDVRSLFNDPLARPMEGKGISSRCKAPTAQIPFTGLARLASESIRRNAGRANEEMSGEWAVLRHLYWVN
jgi:hypothetical protein